MAQDEKPPSFEAFDAELRRLKGARDPGGGGKGPDGPRAKWGVGLQVGIELVAGVAGGTLAGFFLDRWLGTAPLLLILFFMLGAAAGTLNAWRWMRRFEARSSEGGDGG
ncbi:MAG TPA: AtpZ/AtpI family protein [Geminicoccaceae bacterium]|nr:AtpZ/AtpI family protein [Geminicoccus sp.]HMU50480.1 AtpZ/AtpI family protein [Geminicoccaceae bacterium]